MQNQAIIIDDDPVIVKIIEKILDSFSYPYKSFTNPLKAWKYCEENRFEILIVDWDMPGMDGLTITDKVRKLYGDRVVILMLTSYGDESKLAKALEHGVNDYLVKPVTSIQFRTRIQILDNQARIIRERLKMETALQRSRQHFKAIFDNSAVGVLVMSLDGQLLEVNDTILKMLGYLKLETKDSFVLKCIYPADQEKLSLFFQYYTNQQKTSSHYETRLLTRSGLVIWTRLSISTVRSDDDQSGFVIIIVEDITEKRRYEEELSYNALHDSLTGLPNRELFMDRLEAMLNKYRQKKQNEKISVIILDIDRFQVINETFGHAFGDRLINLVAKRLNSILEPDDTLARLSGDEFGILTNRFFSVGDHTHYIGAIRRLLKEPFRLGGEELSITTSIGVNVVSDVSENRSEILRDADIALHKAKKKGPDLFEFFTGKMNEESREMIQLENELRKGIENGELELYYQPQLNLTKKMITGVEGLIRWNHPRLGIVYPDKFIPLAEKVGLIIPIGNFVLKQAVNKIKEWAKMGYYPITMAINFSAPQFMEKDLTKVISGYCKDLHKHDNNLKIELTESVVMENQEEVIETLHELKKLGIELAIDDFGTGYSSLSYLKSLPIDYIKIDASFINNLLSNESDRSIVLAIIAMSHTMKIQSIAEGVETAEQLDLLENMYCDIVQGYFISRPMPEKKLLEYFDKHLGVPYRYGT